MSKHIEFEQIQHFAKNNLSAEELRTCATHFETCSECRALLSRTMEMRQADFLLTDAFYPDRFRFDKEMNRLPSSWEVFITTLSYALKRREVWGGIAVAGMLVIFLVRSINLPSLILPHSTAYQPTPQFPRLFDRNGSVVLKYKRHLPEAVYELLEQTGQWNVVHQEDIDPNAPSAGNETPNSDGSKLTLLLKPLASRVITTALPLQWEIQGKPSKQYPLATPEVSFEKIDAKTQRPFGNPRTLPVAGNGHTVIALKQLPPPGIYDFRIRPLLRGKPTDFCVDSLPIRLVILKQQGEEHPAIMGAAFVLAGELDQAEKAFRQYHLRGERERNSEEVARADHWLSQVQKLKAAQSSRGLVEPVRKP